MPKNQRKPLSIAYDYFIFNEETKKGRCKHPNCSSEIFVSRKKIQNCSEKVNQIFFQWHASTLKRHLERQHKFFVDEDNRSSGEHLLANSSNPPCPKLVSRNEQHIFQAKTKSIDSAMSEVFLHAGVAFDFVDSDQWRQLVKLLNPSYLDRMPSAYTLEKKYGRGNCFVCKSAMSSKRRALQCIIGLEENRVYEILGEKQI